MRIRLVALLLAGSCACGQAAVQEIAQSHIDGNVPSSSDFDRFLRRDLEAYFTSTTGKPAAVQYELLREGATQTGIAYPKFYVWVEVRHDNGTIEQGAARLAAIERKEFDVTDFVPEADIRSRRVDIYKVFPAAVCEKILNRLGLTG